MPAGEIIYRFYLFIAGVNPDSIKAIENIKFLCEEYLENEYELEVIDIYQQKNLLKDMDIIAVPTLIKAAPAPEKRVIGDMSDITYLLKLLEINPGKDETKDDKEK